MMNRIRFYMNGDDTGKLYTETFSTSAELYEFIAEREESIEIFSVEDNG